MTADAVVEDEVRELVRRRGLDPIADPSAVRRLVEEVVADYDERSLDSGQPPLSHPSDTIRLVVDAVAGFGPLQRYLEDPAVEEIWINEPGRVFVARRGCSELTTTILTADEIRDLVERMLRSSGRRVDVSTPFVDATLPDGSRLHVVAPDITREHLAVNIRKFIVRVAHLDELVRIGTLTSAAARFLEASVVCGLNILVAGGTQAGKTTLLNCVAAAIPAQERVVTAEEVFELRISDYAILTTCPIPRQEQHCICGKVSTGAVRGSLSSGSVRRAGSSRRLEVGRSSPSTPTTP